MNYTVLYAAACPIRKNERVNKWKAGTKMLIFISSFVSSDHFWVLSYSRRISAEQPVGYC